jgi:tetratricopeptide (TPR) repeat protein
MAKKRKNELVVNYELRKMCDDLKSSVKNPSDHGSSVRLALFLGAGASVQSDIPAGSGMIRHFINKITNFHGKNFESDEQANNWIKNQEWYQDGVNDYCQLFERCYETEAKRRSYIESIIEKKQPSIGYIVLANLIRVGYIKTVVTTNFDSLTSIACSNYTDIFPVVYSLGNFASEMTVSSERPRILKIHGDFLFSKLKNTAEELMLLDENMKRQVNKLLEEYDGIIVIGYSGNDNSVMSIFEEIKNGKTIYWCDLSLDYISERARNLLKTKNGMFVKIAGFDELMQVIRILAEITNNDIAQIFTDRQVEIDKKIREFEDVVLIDESTKSEIESSSFSDFEKVLDKSKKASQYVFKGEQYQSQVNYKLAEKWYRKALEFEQTKADALYKIGVLLFADQSRWEESEGLFNAAKDLKPMSAIIVNCLGFLRYLQKREDDAIKLFEESIRMDKNLAFPYINLSAIYRKRFERNNDCQDKIKMEEYVEKTRKCLKDIDDYLYAGWYSVKGEIKDALDRLKKAVEKEPVKKLYATYSPTFDFIRDDPRFAEIVGE